MEVKSGHAKLKVINDIPVLLYKKAPLTGSIEIKELGPYYRLTLFWIVEGNCTLAYIICATGKITLVESMKPIEKLNLS